METLNTTPEKETPVANNDKAPTPPPTNDGVEHQESNGDINTTANGNYLKEEGLAEYDGNKKKSEA